MKSPRSWRSRIFGHLPILMTRQAFVPLSFFLKKRSDISHKYSPYSPSKQVIRGTIEPSFIGARHFCALPRCVAVSQLCVPGFSTQLC